MKKYLFAALVAATAISYTSCSNDVLNVDDITNGIDNESVNAGVKKGFYLADASGNEVSSVSGGFGTYYLHINTDGEWKVSSDDVFVTVTKTHGVGSYIVPVYFAENWQGEDRNGMLKVQISPLGESSPAGADSTVVKKDSTIVKNDSTIVKNDSTIVKKDSTSINKKPEAYYGVDSTIIKQYVGYSITEIEKRVSSNLGAGYGYRFDNATLVMNPTIEIFNMPMIVKVSRYVRDDYYPSAYETRYSSTSRDSLNQQISGSGHVNVKWSGFKLGINGGSNIGSTTSDNKDYAAMHASRTYFTRQIEWANAMADHSETNNVLSSGFLYLRNRLTDEIMTVHDDAKMDSAQKVKEINGLVSDFVESVGSVFVTKSSIGASFDYILAVDKSYTNDSITARGVLDLGYTKKVKNDTEADSTATTENKDSINNWNAGGSGAYEKMTEKAYERSSAEISVFGGNVDLVSILARGGTLDMSTFEKWLQSVKPENSVVSDMQFAGIQVLFDNATVRRYIRNYIEHGNCAKDEDDKKTETKDQGTSTDKKEEGTGTDTK